MVGGRMEDKKKMKNKELSVRLLPGLFKERYDKNREYLMSLSNQGLLQNFYLEAGIIIPGLQVLHNPDTDELHWGWEAPTCQLRGHFLGHWLSAASMLYKNDRDKELKAKMEVIVEELARCQELNGGEWIGPIPEKYFWKMEQMQHVWSPQYVMHKTILGLLHCYLYADNEMALLILDKLSNWYLRWTDDMIQKNLSIINKGEESGMLEVWTELYEVTGLDKYMTLAIRYSEPGIFRDLALGKDALTNCHANASIPWSHGAAKLYEVTKEPKWRSRVEEFWKCAVTDRGSYCTGSQNAGEFWTQPKRLASFLSDSNQEFCTVYNMVRTAQYLYEWTKDTKYADYIEKNLYNGFLAQQNKETAMPTYFLSLKAKSRKKWGSRTRDFWCCHGTMVQAQTIYPELIYQQQDNRLLISQYIPSEVVWENEFGKITLIQTLNMKYYNEQAFFDEKDESQMSRWFLRFQVKVGQQNNLTLSFRVPEWVKEKPVITINQEIITDFTIEDGFINLERSWNEDEILIFFPAKLTLVSLPDDENKCAFMEGPIVLAGLCEKEKKISINKEQFEDTLVHLYEHTYNVFPWKQSCYRTKNQDDNITFIPLYDVTEEEYTVYFDISNHKNNIGK